MKDKLRKASKAHVKYRTKDKVLVPGVTTITNLLNKPYLIKWANDLGLEGIDSTKYRDEAADIGTLAMLWYKRTSRGRSWTNPNFRRRK